MACPTLAPDARPTVFMYGGQRKVGLAMQTTGTIDLGDTGGVYTVVPLVHAPDVVHERPKLVPNWRGELDGLLKGEEPLPMHGDIVGDIIQGRCCH